jgi:peptide deformylase
MILPIYLYGQPVLRKQAEKITANYPELTTLVANMFETMYKAEGVGLAAPQVGLSIGLLVIDATGSVEAHPDCKGFKRIMINPEILERSTDTETLEEGCLSLPGIHENVARARRIRVKYMDERFAEHDEVLTGYPARIVQHECEHLQGGVFMDNVSALRRQLNKRKLGDLVKGFTSCRYSVRPVG